jgi:hypothetical protein
VSIDDLSAALEAIERHSASAIVTLVGFLVLFVVVRRLASPKADWRSQRGTIAVGAIAVLLVLSSQALSLWYTNSVSQLPPSAAFDRLVKNATVTWLVRLIPYSRTTTPQLEISHLDYVGRPETDYVFVADYEELKNYTVEQAIYRTGGSLRGASGVSAIIFPLKRRDLIPASARGVLQVLIRIDEKHSADANWKPCEYGELSADATKQLGPYAIGIPTYSWASYSSFYREFETAVFKAQKAAQNGSCPALERLGKIEDDWHPTGYSRVIGTQRLTGPLHSLSLPKGDTISLPQFGARVFLLENLHIGDIPDRVMIDFDDPASDRIPDLGPMRGDLPPF